TSASRSMVAERIIAVAPMCECRSVEHGSYSIVLGHRSRHPAIDVVARRRHAGAAIAPGFREEHLHYSVASARMLVRARRHVQTPHAIPELAHLSYDFIVPAFQAPHPVPARLRVVISQVLAIASLEARLLSLRDQLTQR